MPAEVEADEPAWRSADDLGHELRTMTAHIAAAEGRFLSLLAEFDRREGWYLDGARSAVDWLAWRCGMSRRTARDKVRVAHELTRRPAIAEALARGEITYSVARAITRIEGADPETDRFLLELAAKGTVADIERVVHRSMEIAEQERGVDGYLKRWDRQGLHASTTYDGMGVIETVLPVEDSTELLGLIDAWLDATEPVEGGSREPLSTGTADDDRPRSTLSHRRAQALLAMARAARPTATPAAGADRYTLHLVADIGALVGDTRATAELMDGRSVNIATLRRVACDTGIVRHLLAGESEPLDLGRRTRTWSTAQRRAVQLRDGSCRWPGCATRTADVHHHWHWADGGPTDVANGVLACGRHHTFIHEGGFVVTGDPNGELRFYRPDGTFIGATSPQARGGRCGAVGERQQPGGINGA